MKKRLAGIYKSLVILIVAGCQEDIYNFTHRFVVPQGGKQPPVIEFIVDGQNNENITESYNLHKIADYTKLPYQNIPLRKFNETGDISMTTRVLCVLDTYVLNDAAIDSIMRFVAKGGTLFLTKKNTDLRVAFFQGIKPDANLKIDSTSYGLRFIEPVLPGLKGEIYELEKSVHKGLARDNFSDKISVLATAANHPDFPVIIKNEIGLGRVILFNSDIKMSKGYRGLMFAQTLLGLEGIPYPVANVSTIFLDDYPSPLYNIRKEPIKSEMNLTIADFVTDVWWPDMKALAKKENIKYTAYVTFDYNANITPPFTFREWDKYKMDKNVNGVEQTKSSWLGRDVYNTGHELGFHGYNHVSLLKENWPQDEFIVTALNTAVKKWKTIGFNELPISYVPPSNYIDSFGLAKLQEGIPSIRYIQSTYMGDFEEGGNREFDPEPYNDYFFNYPRISSGYFLEPKSIWAIESLYLFTGIWTHFVHPDDVYQIPSDENSETASDFDYRNKWKMNWHSYKGKRGMLDRFKYDLEEFRKRHPMVRYLNATESSNIVKDWRYAYFSHNRTNGTYIVNNNKNSSDGQYWFMYVSKEHEPIFEEKLRDIADKVVTTPFLQGNLYQIKTKETYLELPDLYFLGEKPSNSTNRIIENVQFEYQNFISARELLAPLTVKIDKLVAEDKLMAATNIVEKLMGEGKPISDDIWLTYIKHMMWQQRESDIWNFLEKLYKLNPSKQVADLSRKTHAKTNYPTLLLREKWLTRQIEWGSADKEVLQEYVDYFNTANHKEIIFMVLKRRAKMEPTPINTSQLVAHLIDNNNENLVSELNNIEPCDENYLKLSTSIAWAYANNFRFDKALEWAKCSDGIEEESMNYWLANSQNFEKLKTIDFQLYLEVLLSNDKKTAFAELQKIKPCDTAYTKYATLIANTYSDFGIYDKAIKWAQCSEDITIFSKLNWWYELKDYPSLQQEYRKYIRYNPQDYKTQLQMASLYLYQSDINSALEILEKVPNEIHDPKLHEQINLDVLNLESDYQRRILENYGKYLDVEKRNAVKKKLRQQEGNSVSTNTSVINDKLDPNTLSNIISLNVYDKKFNIHSFSGTQSLMYQINSVSDTIGNSQRNLIGVEYGYKSNTSKKSILTARARLERDNENKLYYQLGAGAIFNNDEKFNSVNLQYYPVRNGPGHVLGINRVQLENYNEFKFGRQWRHVFSFESNYYTDDQADATLLVRSEYAIAKGDKFRFSPLAEVSYTLGTIDRPQGFPYWIASDRLYGGGGIAIIIGEETGNFYFNADASIFEVKNDESFERYTGSLTYRIKDFTQINAGFEVYTIKNFYSNVFQLGILYNFK
ncbi:DUF2194 domain-containing protein [Arenibacter palladensis]|uniref:DUF2194 domain-containing protein n=1 Tax=Arenibacter palladensis TaxID=237373 RepID=UPI0026E20C34|nr:DUF2194 domain-containing protein [Arenibacter palladensis]MDO6604152.1 DUF2194 domain-containing protein [Arenibacter palladensis]